MKESTAICPGGVLIFLSEKGKATCNDLSSLVEEPESSLVGRLDRCDAEQLRSLLETLLDRS